MRRYRLGTFASKMFFVFVAIILGIATLSAPARAASDSTDPKLIVRDDQYVRLHVELTISNETDQQHITFGNCPDQPLLGEDLRSFVGGEDDQASVGVELTAPGGLKVTLTPISELFKGGLFGFGRSCSSFIDRIKFDTPLYYVHAISGQSFHVYPVASKSKSIDGLATTFVDQLISLVGAYVDVPAQVATKVQAVAKAAIDKAQVSTKDGQGAYLQVIPDLAPQSIPFDIPNLLSDKKKIVTITAKIVPSDFLIAAPKGRQWSTNDVTSASFPIDPSSGGVMSGNTLGNYLNTRFAGDIHNFLQTSTTIDAAKGACGPLNQDAHSLGLSARDAALVLWALVHDNAASATQADPALDHIPCMEKISGDLPTEIPQPRGMPATQGQMSVTVLDDDALFDFFTYAKWDDKSDAGARLFKYSVVVNDPGQLIFAVKAPIASNTGWLELTPQRDQQFLAHLGCYAYFPYDPNHQNLASKLGNRSVMLALGAVPESAPGRNDGREVVMTFYFPPAVPNGPALINQIDVSGVLTPDQRAVFANKHKCGSANWTPALLSGT